MKEMMDPKGNGSKLLDSEESDSFKNQGILVQVSWKFERYLGDVKEPLTNRIHISSRHA